MARLPAQQLELFRAIPGELAARDAQDLMAYPFFSLAKTPRITPIDFKSGEIAIRVEATPEHGMATIWDADVLIWAASQIVEARDAGLRPSRLMAATPYEILTFIGRGVGARDYQRLKAALDRLQSTTVATTIRQPTARRMHRFSWINEWKETADAAGRPYGLELILPDWFFAGVVDHTLVLTIDRAYFSLTGGLERWLYRLVRKHGGRQGGDVALAQALRLGVQRDQPVHMVEGGFASLRIGGFAVHPGRQSTERRELSGQLRAGGQGEAEAVRHIPIDRHVDPGPAGAIAQGAQPGFLLAHEPLGAAWPPRIEGAALLVGDQADRVALASPLGQDVARVAVRILQAFASPRPRRVPRRDSRWPILGAKPPGSAGCGADTPMRGRADRVARSRDRRRGTDRSSAAPGARERSPAHDTPRPPRCKFYERLAKLDWV